MKATLERIYAMAWKEWIHIRRDFRTLYLAFILPVVMILIFGYAVDFDIDGIRMGVVDRDRTEESRSFIALLTAGGWFRLERYETTDSGLMTALDSGQIKIGVFIPEGFARSIRRGDQPEIQALLDGSDNNAATVGQNYLLLGAARYSESIMKDGLNRAGLAGIRIARLSPAPLIYFNPELKSRFYILPGIIALTTAILAALLTSLVIAREWERGTMEQLIATPVRPYEIIIGKIIPYIGISVLQTTMTAVLSVVVFGIPFRGNPIWLLPGAVLFATGTLGLGMMLSSVMKSQLPAMQAAFVATMLPGIILSNFVFPIESMPAIIRMITYIVPAKYFLVVLRTLFLKGTGPEAYVLELVFLALFAAFVLFVATRKTVKRVA